MESAVDADALGAGAPLRRRVTNACEACRATKVKCRTSVQPGICRRPPPPPGPSKTFSLNFEMSSLDESDDIESLAARYDQYFEDFIPSSDMESIDVMFGLDDPGSGPYSSLSSPPSSGSGSGSGPSISISNLGLKPQFNLDSAEKLLQTFRIMLKHFPCVVLPPDATVMSLSKTKPFLLLAILSTASGSSALQGHILYDEEFRKVLGLKFVAAGERTLELIQGLLIYTAW
ncbi:Zn 2cys6 transcription factor [Colletotrichum higginsianum IMI 349063]|uniref:Zn 2cys6 transcription factor n=1 Tax=Colletotrichum higginsianum (strain IMI 349063) TaxID=759273 RepID=A0A1B7XR59_COLHI|nr:Zn 2cys6 transcription factor [Colletotrichum higginsianum IMI 349063]OBR02204.1 Zn 2cys6 transcription factor [Colletotrichum higginsianum IMI 349063]